MSEEKIVGEFISGENLEIIRSQCDSEARFLLEIIGILKHSLRSEDVTEYGSLDSKNLDIFSWETVQDAKKYNLNIKIAIERIEERLAKISDPDLEKTV